MTEKEIIFLYDSGRCEEAFSRIVECYSKRLYLHIRRFVCCHEDADDLVQEVFIKIWAALPSFRRDAQLFTWIYRIATNEVLNFLRKQKIRAMISLDSSESVLAKKIDEDVSFNGDRLQRELHKAILKLPEKQRIVFSLRYFDEMKYEDMAEITGTSVGALKASYHFAYNKVEEEIQKSF
jgi:RNA polymerase sigma-70 factor (ECF subfamily)